MSDCVIGSDSLVLKTSWDANVGAWWFETVIAGTEWDQVLFTKILTLNYCRPSYSRHWTSPAFSHTHACSDHRTVIVLAGQVAIKGFLKMLGPNQVTVRLGTMLRRLQHGSIIGNMNWIPVEVGGTKHCTAHEVGTNWYNFFGAVLSATLLLLVELLASLTWEFLPQVIQSHRSFFSLTTQWWIAGYWK